MGGRLAWHSIGNGVIMEKNHNCRHNPRKDGGTTAFNKHIRNSQISQPKNTSLPAINEYVNALTGEVCVFDKMSVSLYRAKIKINGIVEWAPDNGCDLYFRTRTFGLNLTVSQMDEYRKKEANSLAQFFRDHGLPFKMCSVRSLQLERLLGGDICAEAYHDLIACPAGALPDQISYIGGDGKKHWRTIDKGTLLTTTKLRNRWRDDKKRRLGTVNCSRVNHIGKVVNYLLANIREAEEHHIPKRRRFCCSQLGTYGHPKGLRKLEKAEIAAHPERNYNRFERKGGTVLMQEIMHERDGNHVIHEKLIRSPWTPFPDRWLEKEQELKQNERYQLFIEEDAQAAYEASLDDRPDL